MKQDPRLMRGGLSGRVYVVTSYRDLGNGNVEALVKHDITDDFTTLANEWVGELTRKLTLSEDNNTDLRASLAQAERVLVRGRGNCVMNGHCHAGVR